MNNEIMMKFKEAIMSVTPIVVIVLMLACTIVPIGTMNIFLFLISALFVIIGLTFFTLGADISMMRIGEKVGSHMIKTRNVYYMAFISFLIGVIITIAEPDLKVLASQVPMISDYTLILSVSIGVGIFITIGLLRVLFQVKLSKLLLIFYGIVFLLAAFVPNNFIAVAFDSGGVTTGPMTVPFIMALGIGIASLRKDATSEDDTFGFVALASVGPILIVLILGLLSDTSQITYTAAETMSFTNIGDIFKEFIIVLPEYFKEVSTALLPLLIFFILYDTFALHLETKYLLKICFGLMYTYLGLVLFLTSVNFGFMPIGKLLGNFMVSEGFQNIIIIIGAVIGYFIVAAEPAVIVLKKQVEDITEGKIKGKTLGICLGIGVAVSVALAMIRVITGISIWYMIIPGYLFSLLMMFFVPPIFTAISFDSGGVASGPMTATFLLPFALGVSEALGGNIVEDAFGVVSMVAMIPLITIQGLGLIYNHKTRERLKVEERIRRLISDGDEIVEFEI